MSDSTRWIAAIVGLLGLGVGASVILAIYALSDPSAAIAPDYYNRAANYQQEQIQRGVNESLGWRITWRGVRSGSGCQLYAEIQNKDGAPITDATLEASLAPVRRSTEVQALKFSLRGDSYLAELQLPAGPAQLWDIGARASIGANAYTQTTTTELCGPHI